MNVIHLPRASRAFAAVAVVTLITASAACTSDSDPAVGPSSSTAIPAPDPETTAPAPDADYQQAIVEFCAAATQARSDLQAMTDTAAIDIDALVTVEEQFHDSFAALYAAHQAQFGSELNGSEPLDTGFALDAALAILTDHLQTQDPPTLSSTDPLFVQFDDLAAGCSAPSTPAS